MKYAHVYVLFLMFVFNTPCQGQIKTDLAKDNIKSETKNTITSYGPITMVRNVKKGSNGTILIAASWGGVFRYDGNTFTDFKSKEGQK